MAPLQVSPPYICNFFLTISLIMKNIILKTKQAEDLHISPCRMMQIILMRKSQIKIAVVHFLHMFWKRLHKIPCKITSTLMNTFHHEFCMIGIRILFQDRSHTCFCHFITNTGAYCVRLYQLTHFSNNSRNMVIITVHTKMKSACVIHCLIIEIMHIGRINASAKQER